MDYKLSLQKLRGRKIHQTEMACLIKATASEDCKTRSDRGGARSGVPHSTQEDHQTGNRTSMDEVSCHQQLLTNLVEVINRSLEVISKGDADQKPQTML